MQNLKNNMKGLVATILSLIIYSVSVPVLAKDGSMLYLVEFSANSAGVPTNRGQAITLLDELIVPSLEKLAKENRISAGGLRVGARSGVFILKANSHDDATKIVRALPAWGVWDWTVTPLESFEHRANLETRMVEQLRAMK